ncbi:MAG: hypothetical protein LIP12_09995 [Clostridiales bacterium]|nr:hypothetical protein [Clostridiales bacterium]
MLSSPKHGWATITMQDWSDRCSYLNDIPLDLLETLIRVFKTHNPQAVRIDAEGWEYLLIFDKYDSYIIEEKDDPSLHHIDLNLNNIAKELISDIRKDIDEWTDWFSYRDSTEEELLERKERLLKLCNILENMIEKKPV